ncbi:hypothetical protein, partial [Lysinibacillus sphaericus]|uniref:hypothetical protein n=1 Tax=Lysinibacillus sphaericus TaxID=1421 RepID=UPI001C0A898E
MSNFFGSDQNKPIGFFIAIGKTLKLSPSFPLLHTQRAAFTALGVPSYPFRLKQLNYISYEIGLISPI